MKVTNMVSASVCEYVDKGRHAAILKFLDERDGVDRVERSNERMRGVI